MTINLQEEFEFISMSNICENVKGRLYNFFFKVVA